MRLVRIFACRKRRLAMNGSRTNHHRDVAASDPANAMRDRHTYVSEPRGYLTGDGVELRKRQRCVRFVLQRGNRPPSLVHVAHDAEKGYDATETGRANPAFDGPRVERRFVDRHHPPPTAGNIASSTPSCNTRSDSLIVPSTAKRTPRTSDKLGITSSNRFQASETRAPSTTSIECTPASSSRARANA